MNDLLLEKVFEFLIYTPPWMPYLISFGVLLGCGVGVPIPEDLTLFVMGYLSYNRITNFKISIVVCLLGVILGDILIYCLGRKYGIKLTQKSFFNKILSPERLEKTREKMHKMGNKVILAARFMPGFRAPTYFTAGALKLPFKVFIFYDGLAALVSVPLLLSVTYYFGDKIEWAIKLARQVQHGITFLILGLFVLLTIKYLLMKRPGSKSS
jgi:membrane protein DedA with SNARE-associated domain